MRSALRICRIRVFPLSVPMRRQIKMAGEVVAHAHTLLVEITDEAGRSGWGESCAAPQMTGETLGRLVDGVRYLAERLIGKIVASPEALLEIMDGELFGNASAKSCLEVACMDVLAQREQKPLYALLRQGADLPVPEHLEMLHMLASGDCDRELEDAKTLRAQGYRHWKVKVGAGSLKNDLLRVQRLCQELAGDVVSADANQLLTERSALAIANAGREVGLTYLEQPYLAGDLQRMADLHAQTGLDLCADESIRGISDIAEHWRLGAAQGVSLKLIKLGGLQAFIKAGQWCAANGVKVNLACKIAETTISAAATAHAGFALGGTDWGYSMSNRYLASDVCTDRLAAQEGKVFRHQLERPGLGYRPDETRLRDFLSFSGKPQEWSVPYRLR